MNVIHFTGRLTKTPKIKEKENGNVAILSLQLDVRGRNRTYKIVKCYRNLADDIASNLSLFAPDTQLEVKGSLETERWTDKDGNKKYVDLVWADEVRIIENESSENESSENEFSENESSEELISPF